MSAKRSHRAWRSTISTCRSIAALLAQPAFGPYMNLLASSKAYEPSALAIISFALTWGSVAIIQFLGRGAPGQTPLGGTR